MTKLTGNHDSIARNEKNDAVISSTPNQSQFTRSARRTKDAIARGRKSCASPNRFIAWVRQSSPPTPVSTTKVRTRAVRISARSCRLGGALRSAVDEENSQENQEDSDPARHRNMFAQEYICKQGHQRICNRGKRHHEAVI